MEIEDFAYGRITVEGHTEDFDLILTPSGIHRNWWRDEGHRLTLDDLGAVLDDPPEVLVVGQGTQGRMEPAHGLAEALADRGIRMEAMTTDRAVERTNELLRAGTRVAAALHLTC